MPADPAEWGERVAEEIVADFRLLLTLSTGCRKSSSTCSSLHAAAVDRWRELDPNCSHLTM